MGLGRCSVLSDQSFGEVSTSETLALELPVFMPDMWDSRPYQLEPPLTPTMEQEWTRKLLPPSRAWIHGAIEANNEFAVRTILPLGINVIKEENQNGWTQLLHAAFLCRDAILSAFARKWS